MPRKTRRRLMGGKQEDAARREAEQQLQALEQELHRQQSQRKADVEQHDDSPTEDNA